MHVELRHGSLKFAFHRTYVKIKIYTDIHIYPNHRRNKLARRNYIASNLQDSQVEVCFCVLRIPPVDLAKVHYLDGFSIYFFNNETNYNRHYT